MKGKKGDFLVKNVLGVVIAVIGFAIFIFAMVRLYEINIDADKENAKKTLGIILGKIDNLKDDEGNAFAIQGIKRWYLVGWSKDEDLAVKPDKCTFEGCICICPKADKASCQEDGICRLIGQQRKVHVKMNAVLTTPDLSRRIPATKESGFEVAKQNGYFNCILFPSNLLEIFIDKKVDKITISTNYKANEEFSLSEAPCLFVPSGQ